MVGTERQTSGWGPFAGSRWEPTALRIPCLVWPPQGTRPDNPWATAVSLMSHSQFRRIENHTGACTTSGFMSHSQFDRTEAFRKPKIHFVSVCIEIDTLRAAAVPSFWPAGPLSCMPPYWPLCGETANGSLIEAYGRLRLCLGSAKPPGSHFEASGCLRVCLVWDNPWGAATSLMSHSQFHRTETNTEACTTSGLISHSQFHRIEAHTEARAPEGAGPFRSPNKHFVNLRCVLKSSLCGQLLVPVFGPRGLCRACLRMGLYR